MLSTGFLRMIPRSARLFAKSFQELRENAAKANHGPGVAQELPRGAAQVTASLWERIHLHPLLRLFRKPFLRWRISVSGRARTARALPPAVPPSQKCWPSGRHTDFAAKKYSWPPRGINFSPRFALFISHCPRCKDGSIFFAHMNNDSPAWLTYTGKK